MYDRDNALNRSIIRNGSLRALIVANDSCNFLSSANSTHLAFDSNWENIPETFLLNAIIGFLLLVIFKYMTKIAWKKSFEGPNDKQADQNLITFLYGYRDPKNWYVIPRFEFLRYKHKHHKHILDYPYMYVPPRLPLASPNELFGSSFALQDDTLEDGQSFSSKTIKTVKTGNLRSQHMKMIESRGSNNNRQKAEDSPSMKANKQLENQNSTIGNQNQQQAPRFPGNYESSSYSYPSILTAEHLHGSYLSRKLNAFFAIFFRVTDAEIIYAKGIDAYEYLLFQRHLILIMFITTILCVGIILPIHWLSDPDRKQATVTDFSRTTINNLRPNSEVYWAHIICSIVIVLITIFILISYRNSTTTKYDSQLARRTLLIGNIPKEQRNRVKLMKIFDEYFPNCTIEAIQFIYHTGLIEQYQLQLSSLMVAREYCECYKRKYNREIMVKQTEVNEEQRCSGLCRLCSFFYICCCYWPCESKLPGTVYYLQEERNYREKINEACKDMVENPSEYAFITLRSHRQSRRFIERLTRIKAETLNDVTILESFNLKLKQDQPKSKTSDSKSNKRETTEANQPNGLIGYKANSSEDLLNPKNNPRVRSIRSPDIKKLSTDLTAKKVLDVSTGKTTKSDVVKDHDKRMKLTYDGPVTWSARYAPHPDNIDFYDLLNLTTIGKYTLALYHLLTFVIFVFFTTPNVVLSIIERWSVLNPEQALRKTGYHALFINYLSTLIQIITTALLPTLITLISKQIPYEDSASKNHAIMWKVYAFLVLMVIVMPSVGMKSALAFISGDINPKCLFPTDNGAYFINYVQSSIFLSTVLELIKPTDIVFYAFLLWTARSFADYEGGRQYIAREFSVGSQHTGVLLIFSVVMTYTISCPLIAPAGLVYLIVKHAVDHYHLYYTYFTKKVDDNLQSTIVIFVKISLLLMLFQTGVAITFGNESRLNHFTIISQLIFWITLIVFSFNFFHECSLKSDGNGTISSDKERKSKFHREFCACFYTPRVIADLVRCDAIPESCISRQT